MIPVKEFRMPADGFHGTLHIPAPDGFPGKALILFGGSDGNFQSTCKIARLFCAQGITVMALAFWNVPGLPDEFREIPVDTLEKAALWLRSAGYAQIGLWGVSKGGELALLAGSLMPEVVSCVVAVSPIGAVCQSFSKRRGIRVLPCSSWSWHGQSLPYTLLSLSVVKQIGDCWHAREITMTRAYGPAVEHPLPESVIRVEHIHGPLLLISAKEDAVWPSAKAGEQIMERLCANAFPYAHRHLCYEYGSHLMIPAQSRAVKIFKMERRHPDECRQAKKDAFEQTICFLKSW